MKVLVLTPNLYGYSPGQRTSIELWEEWLNLNGVSLDFAPFETEKLHEVLYQKGYFFTKAVEMIRAYAQRIQRLYDLEDYDAVFVYREAALIGPAWLEKWVARTKPIIYQLDDPLYIPYVSQTNGYFSYLKCFDKVAEICKMSQSVIVNSSFHKQFAQRYNKNVWVVPSIVDTKKYSFVPPSQTEEEMCVGWSGSPSSAVNLKVVAEPLRQLAGRLRHKVHLIGGRDYDLPGVRFSSQPWRSETEIQDLRQIHIGLTPLIENEWNRCKFYLKVVQYMALGIPPVCSPLGSNPEVIQHGINGFLAATEDDWVNCLEALIRDRSLRKKMSENAARTAQEKYSLEANHDQILGAFRSVQHV